MLFKWLFGSAKPIDMTKYLIVGLGNVGNENLKTRHNIGFEVIDFLANNFEVKMTDLKLGAMGSFLLTISVSFLVNLPNTKFI